MELALVGALVGGPHEGNFSCKLQLNLQQEHNGSDRVGGIGLSGVGWGWSAAILAQVWRTSAEPLQSLSRAPPNPDSVECLRYLDTRTMILTKVSALERLWRGSRRGSGAAVERRSGSETLKGESCHFAGLENKLCQISGLRGCAAAGRLEHQRAIRARPRRGPRVGDPTRRNCIVEQKRVLVCSPNLQKGNFRP